MKKIILMAVVLLLLVAGGFAGYSYFGSSAVASVPRDTDHTIAKGEHLEEEKGGGELELVQMSPLVLPIISEDGVSQVVSMIISLEVDGLSEVDELKALLPKLQNAYLTKMYGVLGRHATHGDGDVLKVNYIRRLLKEVANEVVGEDLVQSVVIEVVQQRDV